MVGIFEQVFVVGGSLNRWDGGKGGLSPIGPMSVESGTVDRTKHGARNRAPPTGRLVFFGVAPPLVVKLRRPVDFHGEKWASFIGSTFQGNPSPKKRRKNGSTGQLGKWVAKEERQVVAVLCLVSKALK